jgi:uncharacterized membrane protein
MVEWQPLVSPGEGAVMYLAIVLLLMLILPVVSIAAEAMLAADSSLVFLIGKWFVFWGVGLRVLIAGIRQVARPAFTAETIFGITDPKAFHLVEELGFGNLAISLLATASLLQPAWITPAALAGCIFFGLAGYGHFHQQSRNRLKTIAMVSDFWIALVLAGYLAATAYSALAAA